MSELTHSEDEAGSCWRCGHDWPCKWEWRKQLDAANERARVAESWAARWKTAAKLYRAEWLRVSARYVLLRVWVALATPAAVEPR